MAVSKISLLTALLPALLLASRAFADHSVSVKEAKARHLADKRRAERDCVPINGRYGYYGNPWCDTGSSRPPDIEFRERQRLRTR